MILPLLLAVQEPIDTSPARIPRPPDIGHQQCQARPSPDHAELIAIGHYENAALSTAWVGNPAHEALGADVELAPGPPLHLVIATYGHNIYRFSGATERVVRLTLFSEYAVAVVGIRRSRVEFAGPCVRYDLFYGQNTTSAEEALRRLYTRSVSVAGAYSIRRARIERQVRIEPVRNLRLRADPETESMLGFSPGGVMRIDPREMVSDTAVGSFTVLPQEAGIRQLVRAGALVRATEDDARRWEAQARRRGVERPHAVYGHYYGIYRVTRPITLPAGLCGAHSVYLYAPSPAYIRGNRCHSTVYFDDGTMIGS